MATINVQTAQVSATAYPATLTVTPAGVWQGGGGISAGAWQAIQRQKELERIKADDDRVLLMMVRAFLERL